MVNNSYSTSGTTHDTLVHNPVIGHECGKDRAVILTSEVATNDRAVILTSEVATNDTDITYRVLQSHGDVKQIVHNL